MVENTPESLVRRIKKNFPDVQCKTYKYIDEGWDHQVMIVDDKLVFRFPLDDEYARLLKSEIKILKRLKPLVSITIPDYSHIAAETSFAGYPLITGVPLKRKYFDTLSLDDQDSFAQQLARFLSTIHTLIDQGHNFNEVVLSDMPEWQDEQKLATKKDFTKVLSPEDLIKVQAILAKVDEVLKLPYPSVFLHGDVYSRHLLWDKANQRLGLIDFSDMNRGDPAFDFAELYEYGQGFVNKVYNYYTGPKDNTFLQRAFTYQQWVGVFMMTDYFINHKTSFEVARETFDNFKDQQFDL